MTMIQTIDRARCQSRISRAWMESLEHRLLCTTVTLADYFPLAAEVDWHYVGTSNGAPVDFHSSLQNTQTNHGVLTYSFHDDVDEVMFLSNDANGLRLHRLENSAEVADFPDVTLTPASVTVGQTLTISGTTSGAGSGSSYVGSVAGTMDFIGFETVTTPAGAFNALKAVLTLASDLTLAVGGARHEQMIETFWLVESLGPVQLTKATNAGDNAVLQLAASSSANQNFVLHMYQDTLQQAPDIARHWDALLESRQMTSAEVASAFINSNEYRSSVIEGLYQSVLGRGAEPAGLAYWLSFFAGGHTVEEMKAQFYGSQEFFNNSGGSNAALVDAFYVALLHRHAEPAGLAHWKYLLDNGAGRGDIAMAIESLSMEGAQTIVRHAYQTFLRREPEPAGLAYWMAQIQAGASELTIISGFLGSEEYFNLT